ncbi:S8 family serine peptidase [candidate division WOR-3 bacterium]|nr:S8 family serine peptidase [candidate division WOR-3 bacterium]
MKLKYLTFAVIFILTAGAVFAEVVHKPGEVIVKFRNSMRDGLDFEADRGILSSNIPSLNSIFKEYSITGFRQVVSNYDYERNIDYGLDMIYVFVSEEDQKAVSSMEAFSRHPLVDYCELNAQMEKTGAISASPWDPFLTPNDPYYSSQWFLPNIQAPQAWDIQTGNHTKIAAIVDDGCEMGHADLAGNYITGYDYVSNDPNPTPPNSSDNHGTHCSGLAAAVSNNSTGIASVGYGIGLIGVRTALYVDQLVNGINFSAQNGASAISMSWGSNSSFASIVNAINDAYNNYDVVCLAAAGNYSSSTQFYPAAGANTVAVAATNSSNQKANFSNYGTWIDISAPGVNMYSTIPFGTYGYMDGTSMACPLTAGLVTLMRCQFPGENNAQIIQRMYDAADAMPGCSYYNNGWMGAGKINAYNSLQGASNDTSIIVTSPNGGETWYIGTVHNITWTDNNVDNFDIHYSTNNGSAWISVASNITGNSRAWTIPNTSSTQCLVRVRDHNHTSISDVCDAVFTITTQPVSQCDTLTYWDWGTVGTSFNYGDPPEWMGMGVRFTPTELSPYSGRYIEKVIFMLTDGTNPANDARIYIFGNGTSAAPGDTLLNISFAVTGSEQWYEITLGANHVPVNASGDMWVLAGFTYQNSSSYPFPANTSSFVANKSEWAWTASGGWEKLSTYSYDYGWTVGVVVCMQNGVEEIIFPGLKPELSMSAGYDTNDGTLRIDYFLPSSGLVSLKAFDVTGRVVQTPFEGRQSSGSHSLSVSADDLPGAGNYFYVLTTDHGRVYSKVFILD